MNEYILYLHHTKPKLFWFVRSGEKLYRMKDIIGKDDNYKYWNQAKQYTNEYELVYNPKPKTILYSLKNKILSRAFYKFYEIINEHILYDLIPYSTSNIKIKTLHLAEGPGGFIQAWNSIRKREICNRNININNKDDRLELDDMYGITLYHNKSKNIHGWNIGSRYFKNNNNIKVDYGIDGTGDLFHKCNIEHVINKYRLDKALLITGDGGFDFSSDFSSQEINSFILLFIQCYIAIKSQNIGGLFILKFFDIFNIATIQLIYMMSCLYSNYNIVKPKTSRPANSEKYIIFSNFKNVLSDEEILKWDNLLDSLLKYQNDNNESKGYIYRISMNSINHTFLNDLYNKLKPFVSSQLHNFENTLIIMDKIKKELNIDNRNEIKENQLNKQRDWLLRNPIDMKYMN
jgi:hypothetical protein